jgi:hypothetical protein
MTRLIASLLLILFLPLAPAFAGPPANGLPLSEIVRRIEAEPGFIYIRSVRWNDDSWEITYYRGDQIRTVRIHPRTGRARS